MKVIGFSNGLVMDDPSLDQKMYDRSKKSIVGESQPGYFSFACSSFACSSFG